MKNKTDIELDGIPFDELCPYNTLGEPDYTDLENGRWVVGEGLYRDE